MDVTSMAERMSAAVSSVGSESSAAPAEISTPTSTTSAPLTDLAPIAETPGIQFEDDPPELDFDTESPENLVSAPAPTIAPPVSKPTTVPPSQGMTPEEEEETFGGMLDKRVEIEFLKTNRGRHLLGTYKSVRELREAPKFDAQTGENTGGLGFMPTPQQIKEYHQRASDWEASHQEFETNPQSWVVNHFMGDGGTTIRPGAEQVLSTIPAAINAAYERAEQSGDRQAQDRALAAFKSVFNPMAVEYIDGLYDRARRIADPEQRERYLNGARTIEFDLTGKARGDDQLAPPKPEDHLAVRERQLQEREQQLNTWQQKNQSEAATAARNDVFNNIGATLTKDIERAFDTAGLRTALKPFAYNAAVNAYKAQVMDAVKQNRFAWRDINFAMTKVGPGNADAALRASELYRQTSREAIRNSYRNVLKDLVDGSVSQNATQRATAAAAASQTAPSVNGGQTPGRSIVPETRVERRAGEDKAEYNARRLNTALGVAR